MLKCSSCSKEYPESSLIWRCSCGGYLLLGMDIIGGFGNINFTQRPSTQWRYREILPLQDDSFITSMGEGMTPLVTASWGGVDVLFKLDFLCPTGSYKDRGISFLVSKLRELGVRHVIEDSSGNAGASMAAYCGRAGIKCEIFVPEYTSKGKCVQIESYGASIRLVPGTREDTRNAAESAATNVYYASHNWSPYFAHGIKTLAWELWEQMAGDLPDSIIVPAGQGSLVMGLYLGFSEIQNAGKIRRIPAIHAVQSERCAPLYQAFEKGLDKPVSIDKIETIAEGISSAEPVKGNIVLDNVRKSGGSFLAVSEQEIWDSFIKLGSLGFYVEPTSAVVGAAIDRLLMKNKILPSDKVVAILTGSGLKATDKILHLKEKPPGGSD